MASVLEDVPNILQSAMLFSPHHKAAALLIQSLSPSASSQSLAYAGRAEKLQNINFL
jgi:hypothetical protein